MKPLAIGKAASISFIFIGASFSQWPSFAEESYNYNFATCSSHLAEMRQLILDLKTFSTDSTFAIYGFAKGQGKTWMTQAKNLQSKSAASSGLSASDYIAVPGDVIGWGISMMHCASNKGSCDYDYINFVETEVDGMVCPSDKQFNQE
ncbi:MAG: hypothetical protein CTY31_12335 [Hyphomicrobium sp.]|nr:MAG: hypothetical protein CTY39_06265 [Hyphomicrobium sp.]PPC98800.1 MAG: hypothetical protein CTY31_12335 [Hyphomicrobium sp.]